MPPEITPDNYLEHIAALQQTLNESGDHDKASDISYATLDAMEFLIACHQRRAQGNMPQEIAVPMPQKEEQKEIPTDAVFDTRAALKGLRGKMSQEEAAMRMRLNREEVSQDWVCRAEKSMALVRWDALEKYIRLLGGDDALVAKFKAEHEKHPHMPIKKKNGFLHVEPLPA